jgi:hypothetical protein
MRKLVMLALSLGAVSFIKRRALRSGMLPAAVVAVLAEQAVSWLRSDRSSPPPAPPKQSWWSRLKPAPASPPAQG